VVLRFAYFYGAGDGFTENLLSGVRRGWLPVPGRSAAYLPMLSHEDAARAVVAALDAPSGRSWQQAITIAHEVYRGRRLSEMHGATHYHATYVYPDWAPRLKRVTKIGHQVEAVRTSSWRGTSGQRRSRTERQYGSRST